MFVRFCTIRCSKCFLELKRQNKTQTVSNYAWIIFLSDALLFFPFVCTFLTRLLFKILFKADRELSEEQVNGKQAWHKTDDRY